jgi:nucleoside-diphosphate-sugar epimerase
MTATARPHAIATKTRNAEAVVRDDLQTICERVRPDLHRLGGKRVLITGGGGFLGYYFVQALLYWNDSARQADRTHVTVIDNYIRGVPAWLAALTPRPDLELIAHDVTRQLPAGLGPFHYVIHAASIASPVFYRQYPLETMDSNVNGLRMLLEQSKDGWGSSESIDGFLFFSTSEIYGDPPPEQIPTPEDFRGNVSCTGPRACYDESKRYGETLSVIFAERFGLPIKIVRPFNNYGPGLRLDDRRVIADFARDILAGDDIVLLSDGSPTRTFCYVADAVVGYIQALVRGRSGHAYNIGAEEPEVSVTELAHRLVRVGKDVCGYGGRVVHGRDNDPRYLTDNPARRCPSTHKARTELGFSSEIGLDEGLRRTLSWYLGANSPSGSLR